MFIYPFTFFDNLPNEFENIEKTKIDTSGDTQQKKPVNKHIK